LWGLGFGFWGSAPNPKTPIPNPQSPIPNINISTKIKFLNNNLNNSLYKNFSL